jgi:hypothetical protein
MCYRMERIYPISVQETQAKNVFLPIRHLRYRFLLCLVSYHYFDSFLYVHEYSCKNDTDFELIWRKSVSSYFNIAENLIHTNY